VAVKFVSTPSLKSLPPRTVNKSLYEIFAARDITGKATIIYLSRLMMILLDLE
jgi:hypothetical protein